MLITYKHIDQEVRNKFPVFVVQLGVQRIDKGFSLSVVGFDERTTTGNQPAFRSSWGTYPIPYVLEDGDELVGLYTYADLGNGLAAWPAIRCEDREGRGIQLACPYGL